MMLLDKSDGEMTFEQITALDFIISYGEYFDVSSYSLNGKNDFAFSELSTRRSKIGEAVKSLVLKGIILVIQSKKGITYQLSEMGKEKSQRLHSEYAIEYKKIAKRAINKYSTYSDLKLLNEVNDKATCSFKGD